VSTAQSQARPVGKREREERKKEKKSERKPHKRLIHETTVAVAVAVAGGGEEINGNRWEMKMR
jgi:ribosomal protein S8E